jgi:hypothetical protein
MHQPLVVPHLGQLYAGFGSTAETGGDDGGDGSDGSDGGGGDGSDGGGGDLAKRRIEWRSYARWAFAIVWKIASAATPGCS